jgi:regulator of nucleoside diphosphate kinase
LRDGHHAKGRTIGPAANPTTEMKMADLPPIYLTQSDLDRLLKLVEAQPGQQLAPLEKELVRATVVPRGEIPDDVVTMNSRVIFENETTGERREVTLVFPGNADIDAGRISVSVPVGTALLGLRAGQSIDWELPGGQKQRYRIVKVPFQPEAAGETG